MHKGGLVNPLCLDLGIHTGWAVRADSGIIFGHYNFKESRWSGGGMMFLKFNLALKELYANSRFDCVYYEEVRRHLGGDAAQVYGGFQATLAAFCERNKIPYDSVPVGTIKKTVTGSGNAGKDKIQKQVREVHGVPTTTEDEADAVAILLTVEQTILGL